MRYELKPNIAFAGLTAAGKTTHARLLAAELDYQYVSATQIMLEIIGLNASPETAWFTNYGEIEEARRSRSVDGELDRRLLHMAEVETGIVFDTWALAWLSDSPLIRLWIESDGPSRTRKCFVSQLPSRLRTMQECAELIQKKDQDTRDAFIKMHKYDIFRDRYKYDIIVDSSSLIPEPTDEAAKRGIERFSKVISDVVAFKLDLIIRRSTSVSYRPSSDLIIKRHPNLVRRLR